MRNSNFFGAPPLGVGVFGKLPAARKRKDRQRNRLGRSQQAPASPRNRKPAGDLARQIEPLPSRSRRLLDYESSDSPSPSRSYRRPETESLPVTELTGSNLRHARPGAGRCPGETGRPAEQSQWNHPVTGIADRQEDRRVRLLNRVVSQTARRALHTLSRNEKFEFFWCPLPWGSECSGNYQPRGNGKTARGIGSADPRRLPPAPGTESPLEIWLGRSNRPRADLAGTWTTRVQARRVPADPTAARKPKACWRCGSADRPAPKQISQAPGLREFRLAESEQILPLIGNRKPASDRGHWLQPAPCSSRRRSCPGGEW